MQSVEGNEGMSYANGPLSCSPETPVRFQMPTYSMISFYAQFLVKLWTNPRMLVSLLSLLKNEYNDLISAEPRIT